MKIPMLFSTKKKINKLTSPFIFALLINICHAQENLPVNFYVNAGFNLSEIKSKYGPFALTDPSPDSKLGHNIGLSAEIAALKNFFIEPRLSYITKGSVYNYVFNDASKAKKTINIAYLSLTTDFKYKKPIKKHNLTISAGPYFARAISGKMTFVFNNFKNSAKLIFKNNNSTTSYTYSKIDAGINFAVGYEFLNRFSWELFTQWGLTNIYPVYTEAGLFNSQTIFKNRTLGLNLRYRLNKFH